MRRSHLRLPCLILITISLVSIHSHGRPFLVILSDDDLRDPINPNSPSEEPIDADTESPERDEFGDGDSKSEEDLDPGSWRSILEPNKEEVVEKEKDEEELVYYSGVSKMMAAASGGGFGVVEEAVAEIEGVAKRGNANARSVLGFMHGMGMGKKRNQAKGVLYHEFAAQGGNWQSKMALAHIYVRQDMYEKAVKYYSELAEVAVKSFSISKDSPVIESIRIHVGAEENKEALRKSRGEDDEDFQILEYQAQKGNAGAMHKIGLFYYFGLRGLRRDPVKALSWFLKAVEKGEPRSMELLGEMYVRGAGVDRNHTKALEWLMLAAKQNLYSAYNGIGYMYVKGYGVEKKNFTKAKECFEKAADNKDPGGYYNLGVLYLKGIGVEKDVKLACNYFLLATNAGQPKAFYQLAKMFHTGVGLKKNIHMATALYKMVAERGPWSSLSRWAREAYLKGDVGKALLLYSRMAELGYEVAQSNAAWILDKYGEHSLCIGESSFCTAAERHQRAHSLWWQASEQGNEHAALLIGDAYYYGRGTDQDYERAAEAYMHAKSQSNAQAMFNLGYMHEHGQGLPYDLHLAKRYYDLALENEPAASFAVTLALKSLWIRQNYQNCFLVHAIDSLPKLYPEVEKWVEIAIMEEGTATILTLFVCLLTVLFLRERQRRQAAIPANQIAMAGQIDDHFIQPPR